MAAVWGWIDEMGEPDRGDVQRRNKALEETLEEA